MVVNDGLTRKFAGKPNLLACYVTEMAEISHIMG